MMYSFNGRLSALSIVLAIILTMGVPARAGEQPAGADLREDTIDEGISRVLAVIDMMKLDVNSYQVYGETDLSSAYLDEERLKRVTNQAGTALGLRADKIKIDVMREGVGCRTYYLGGLSAREERIQFVTYSSEADKDQVSSGSNNSRLQVIITGQSRSREQVGENVKNWRERLFDIFPRLGVGTNSSVRWSITAEVDGTLPAYERKELLETVYQEFELKQVSGRLGSEKGAISAESHLFGEGYTLEDEDRSRHYNFFLHLNYDPQKDATYLDLGTAPAGLSI